ncbi:hypothetical protein G7Z17_g3558 [Cylindrodendrum hubeiense]|uniref:F-box domain-containing protein n=1 Tax=Cylindrodendrum hubeiense TaxID=595255 RepID=A0A9P5HAJ6_9HYPO|nr:hypothetical protein G7Z17_g3558 [Cylindrodendrum hubeiense]
MGYSEVHCHICGVSFNIGRIRTPSEPRTAAWSSSTYFDGTYVGSKHYSGSRCPPGCMVALRPRRNRWGFPPKGYADPDEPVSAESSSRHGRLFPEHPDPLPADGIDRRFRGIGSTYDLEHIAGPECSYTLVAGGGYLGQSISVQEMKGCNTVQCLVRKPQNWEPEHGDEEFEKSGSFFLSGLSDYMPSRDGPYLEVFPARHSCQTVKAENFLLDESLRTEYALPFHPSCLEVFKQASLWRHGKIDVEALTGWWELEANETSFYQFPRDPAVIEARGQFWSHRSGTEHVVANPCYVPGLDSLFALAQQNEATAETVAVDEIEQPHHEPTVVDPFSCLPQEVRTMILLQLAFEDIGKLQLSSRSFRHIPDGVFHALIIQEWPWVWEAWSQLDYSKWASKTSKELRAFVESHQGQVESSDDGSLVSEMEHANDESQSEVRRNDPSSLTKSVQTSRILQNAHTTDWRKVRLALSAKLANNQFKGLHNRQRIWKDCDEIMDRVENYRREGKL